MTNETDNASDGGRLDGMQIQAENIAFKADEMIACAKCGKANPPNRASCLYCATPIELPEERRLEAKLNLRPLENWEKGFNIVFMPSADDRDTAGMASYLSIDRGVLREMLSATRPFPIARIESEAEAVIAVQQLGKFGLLATIVGDEILQADKLPIRLRGIEFRDSSIVVTAFNTGEKTEIGSEDVRMVVAGSVIESKRESVEKRKKKGTKLLQEIETASDEKLLDFYCGSDMIGFRVPTKGFDFSCLGAEKGLLAAENMDRLLERLFKFSPTAKMIEEYGAVANVLSTVWELDRRKDFQGLTRTGIGRAGFGNVVWTSNLTQFTKDSRLQRHLL